MLGSCAIAIVFFVIGLPFSPHDHNSDTAKSVIADQILPKDKVEVVYEEIEHGNGSAVGVSKLFGRFSVNGGSQMGLFSEQKLEKSAHRLLKIFEGEFC